jgi:enhancer of mRNA-decapping protein 3
VTCPANGKYVNEFTIKASEIVELVEAPNENIVPRNAVPPVPVAVPQTKTFEDPAILSMGKRPAPVGQHVQWQPPLMERMDSSRTVTSRDDRALKNITPALSLVEPLQQVHVAEVEADGFAGGLILEELEAEAAAEAEVEILQPTVKQQQKKKRSRRGKKASEATYLEPDVTPAKETTRAKGWRQTPMLEPNPSFQPFATLKKKGRANGRPDENGWATEDATDVQDMGEFDFASSLAKFDKKGVFAQIQAEDGIADEDRLVAHNRISRAKPGTAGGKNLHYTENVLDVPNGTPKVKADVWKSEEDDSDLGERSGRKEPGSGRQSRRADSKLSSNRRSVSRKGSATLVNTQLQPARTLSVGSPRIILWSQILTTHKIPTAPKPSFFLVPSDRRCEPISALQMLNLENIADNELGLSEDMMAENAGRGIAEVALSALNTGGRGLILQKSTIIPTVVVFAGNNKSGFRAVAAARHLRNHGLNVIVCVLGLERETELLVGLRRQLKVFRSFGGKLVTKVELLEYVKTLNAPIELIIDGLLGLTISFEELRTGDQATAYELIEFANRSKAAVLAIDIPTGIDPTTGKVSIIDGRQLYIQAKYVVAMGAPKKGLLETMVLGEGVVDEDDAGKGKEWQLFVADIGLGAAAWKKAGTRVRRGVEFEGSWVIGMRFQGSTE